MLHSGASPRVDAIGAQLVLRQPTVGGAFVAVPNTLGADVPQIAEQQLAGAHGIGVAPPYIDVVERALRQNQKSVHSRQCWTVVDGQTVQNG